jgi:hypothetical protein
MKKTVLGLVFLLGAWALFAQEAGTGAVIREINGTVELKTPDAADWVPARQGQRITQNAVISTGFKSSALLTIGNSTLSVQALTRLSLEELVRAEGGEKVDLNLRAGRIRANVQPPAGGTTSFTVRSPSATASVRGTTFEFDGNQTFVDEGRVRVTGGDGSSAYVGAGHQVRTDTETGRTISVAETAREALAPSVPVGVDNVPETKPAFPLTGDIEGGFEWL